MSLTCGFLVDRGCSTSLPDQHADRGALGAVGDLANGPAPPELVAAEVRLGVPLLHLALGRAPPAARVRLLHLGQRLLERLGRDRGDDGAPGAAGLGAGDRKSTRLNSSHSSISYAVFCLKK